MGLRSGAVPPAVRSNLKSGPRAQSRLGGTPLLVLVALVAFGTSGAFGRGLAARPGELSPQHRVTRTLHDAYTRIARPLTAVRPRLVAPARVLVVGVRPSVVEPGAVLVAGADSVGPLDRLIVTRLDLPPPSGRV